MAPLKPATHGRPAPSKGPQPTKAPVDADIRVCLDFIKGRCTRSRCRFHHPEMAGYQQVSNAVQASAGKQICEVWAMAGQCKFGSKCNKLHPVVLAEPSQPAATVAAPAPPPPLTPGAAALAVLPQRRSPPTLFTSPPSLGASPPTATLSLTPAAAPAPLPFRPAFPGPLLALPPNGPALTQLQPARAQADAEAEFQDLAQSILKALETEEEWEPILSVVPTKGLPSALVDSPQKGRSLPALFGMDRVFLDILSDLNMTAC